MGRHQKYIVQKFIDNNLVFEKEFSTKKEAVMFYKKDKPNYNINPKE